MDSNYSGGSYRAAPNSTMAVISLIAGILGLSLFPTIGSIIALIIGYMARNEIRASAGSLGGDGLATAGIVLGWIGIGLTVIGLCIAGFFLIPLCLIPLGIGLEGMSLLYPVFFLV